MTRRIVTKTGTYHAVRPGTEEIPAPGSPTQATAITSCGHRVAGSLGYCLSTLITCKTCRRVLGHAALGLGGTKR